jgi:hypothetical protein
LQSDVTPQVLWFFVRDGRVYGPIPTERIQEFGRTGLIAGDTSVRNTLFDRWVEAAKVPALRSMLTVPSGSAPVGVVPADIPSGRHGKFQFSMFPLSPRVATAALKLVSASALVLGAKVWWIRSGQTFVAAHVAGAMVAWFCALMISGWLAAFIAYLVFRKSRTAANVAFAVVAVFLMIGKWGQFRDATHATQQASALERPTVAQIAEDIRGTADATTTSDAQVPAGVVRKPADAKSVNGADRMFEFGQTFVNEMLDARRRYEKAVLEARLGNMLAADRLVNPSSYALSRERLKSLRQALVRYEAEVPGAAANLNQRLKTSGIPLYRQKEFLSDFQPEQRESEKYFRTFVAQEKQIILSMQAALDFMEPRVSSVKLNRGRLAFQSVADANRYDQLVSKFNAALQQQKQFQLQAEKTAQQQTDRLAEMNRN